MAKKSKSKLLQDADFKEAINRFKLEIKEKFGCDIWVTAKVLLKPNPNEEQIKEIQRAVEYITDIKMDSITGRKRHGDIAFARGLYVWALYEFVPEANYPYIANAMKMNHASCMYLKKRVDELVLIEDEKTARAVRRLRAIINM